MAEILTHCDDAGAIRGYLKGLSIVGGETHSATMDRWTKLATCWRRNDDKRCNGWRA